MTLLGHTRAMDLPEDEENLKQCVKQSFSDVLLLHPVSDFFMQLKDASWGEFVDVSVGQRIPDRSVLRAQVIEQVGRCIYNSIVVGCTVCAFKSIWILLSRYSGIHLCLLFLYAGSYCVHSHSLPGNSAGKSGRCWVRGKFWCRAWANICGKCS